MRIFNSIFILLGKRKESRRVHGADPEGSGRPLANIAGGVGGHQKPDERWEMIEFSKEEEKQQSHILIAPKCSITRHNSFMIVHSILHAALCNAKHAIYASSFSKGGQWGRRNTRRNHCMHHYRSISVYLSLYLSPSSYFESLDPFLSYFSNL